MKWSILITLAVACLSFRPLVQSDVLDHQVTLDYQQATLRQILNDINTHYQIKFAYLNNEMPEEPKFSIQVQDQALRLVLDELLANTSLSYRVVNGQVVLKKEPYAAPTAQPMRSGETRYQPTKAEVSKDTVGSAPSVSSDGEVTSPAALVQEAESLPSINASAKLTTNTGSLLDQRMSRIPSVVPTRVKVATAKPTGVKVAPMQHPLGDMAPVDTAARLPNLIDSERLSSVEKNRKNANVQPEKQSEFGQKFTRGVRGTIDKILPESIADSSDYLRRFLHLGLIYPLSTNGLQAGRTVNEVSYHLLVGYAAGLDGAEFSAIGNVENDFVDGAQFAGVFNVVRQRVDGLQAAGFLNASGGDTQGAQLSGFVNVGAGTIDGLQATGFVNVTTGWQQGGQLSGFMNLLTDSLWGVQGTGFVNVATGGVQGAQLSGFVNYTRHLRGLQATGFVNVASGDVRGVQLAGFVNYAHHVKGAQIGLLNIADSIDGIPIGLVSFVRKNGYRRLELWYGDALQANVAFKMGVPRFYNMLVFGTQFTDTNLRWGLGYGVGTMLPITSAFGINIDLFTVQVHEENQRIFESPNLNLLNTLRLGFNLHLSPRFSLWAAPTFNVMVSQYQQPDSQRIGSATVPAWASYNRTFNNRTNVTMWPGFQVGVRF